MKTLELTIYPKPRYALTAWQYQTDPSKRLTDAELAAEMHSANSAAWRAHSAKSCALPLLEDRFKTLARFAKLPHYDECPPRTEGDKPHCPDCSGIVCETGVVW